MIGGDVINNNSLVNIVGYEMIVAFYCVSLLVFGDFKLPKSIIFLNIYKQKYSDLSSSI